MIALADVRPGDVVFGPIGGLVPGVFPVGAGQILLADRKARLSWRRWWKIRHVLVVTEEASGGYEDRSTPGQAHVVGIGPKAVQAMPGGAEEIELTAAWHWTKDYVYVRPAYRTDASELEFAQAAAVAAAARSYIGTPYNFLTYGKLAAGHLHLGLTERTLRKWISTRKDMMCSQLADQCLADAGFYVFDDGRLPQDVVPSELYLKLLGMPGTQWWIPGRDGEFENWPPGTN
jgi:hypothetical protein